MIILGVSGSIAAYKAIDVAKSLLECGEDIRIVMSKSAVDFISPLTLRSLFPGKVYLHDQALSEQDEMLHISLAKAAKLILIAPASANMIASIANGFASCLLSSICLATEAPILFAPAMNKIMWENEKVQSNVAKLKYIIGPANGLQACGDNGFGRMVEASEIIDYVQNFSTAKLLRNKKIVITAGPTLEAIDPVRFLSNYSSGKMGYAIAKRAAMMGAAEVTLISGPTSLTPPINVKCVKVISADEMLTSAMEYAKEADVFIASAAVADYKPINYHAKKIKKNSDILNIELAQNPDIIKIVKQTYPQILTVGFAAETNNVVEHGMNKLLTKNLDMVAINDVSNGKVFGEDYNALHIINRDNKHHLIARDKKDKVAQLLLEYIVTTYFPSQNVQ